MSDESKPTESKFDPIMDDLPEGMDPFDDAILKQLIESRRNNNKSKRQKLARDWFRAELFYNGVQWVTFDPQLRRWRETGLKKWMPRPVTNKYASNADVFASLVSSVPVETTYRPLNPGSDLSQAKVSVANDLCEAIQQVTKFAEKQREAAPCFARQGEVFLIPFLKSPELKYNDRESERQMEDGFQQELEGQPDAPPFTQLAEKAWGMAKGQPTQMEAPDNPDQADSSPAGLPELTVDVATAFECYMDEEAKDLKDSAFFIRERAQDVSKMKTMFPEKADLIRPKKKTSGDISRYYAGSLSQLTSSQFGDTGFFSGGGFGQSNRTDVTQFWHDPCKNYPKGIYVIQVGDNIVHKGHLPYQYKDGKYYKNIVHLRAKKRADSIHGRTPLDDALQKQIQRNSLEAFIEMVVHKTAAPLWKIPAGCGVESITNEPGGMVEYKRVSASQNQVLTPEMVQGANLPPFIMQWLEKIDSDTEEVLGITKVLLGQLPPGTPAARALELLLDRARARHGDLFFEWNAKWAECMNMLLNIVQQTKPVDIFKATKKTFGGFEMKMFNEGDYDLDLDIVPETEQPAPPRSTMAELDLLETFFKTQLFAQPPNVVYSVLKRFGMEYLNKDVDTEKEYVEREHFELTKENKPPIVKIIDMHPLHLEDHKRFAKTDQYLEWAKANPELDQLFMQHISDHEMVQMQSQMAMMQGGGGMPPPPGAGQPPPSVPGA